MNYILNNARPIIRETRLWITDPEVRSIFSRFRCSYTLTDGFSKKQAAGLFIREQRSKEGTLGYVLCNPMTGENWLWVISKKTRKPFALARVS